MSVRPVALGRLDCAVERRDDGSVIVRATEKLAPYPARLTERLEHWARVRPDHAFLARRERGGDWRRVSYADALETIRRIAAALLARGLSPERPIAILCGNGLEHALLALAAVHVGIPYTPVSVAYSLVSTDYGKLRHIIGNLTPGMVFVDDGLRYARAIAATVPDDVEVVCVRNPSNERAMTPFDALLAERGDGVDAAAARVGPATVTKILFTSGSTGTPKGVINTQGMWCANQQMIVQSLPFLAEEPPLLLDWTPWNHTFGGNHDFGLILYNGGTLYIDDGKPTPDGIAESVRNLREIAPTFYLNVPKGFEEVLGYLRREPALRDRFFSRVKLLFYAGAGLGQHVMDAYDALAEETVGERIQWLAGFGSTETSPFCLVNRPDLVVAGAIGLPAPGVGIKLAPVADKLEGRVRGPHVTPGYWREPALTAAAFDEEGWYRFGDAMKLWDETRPELGLA
ncbi:MAG: AMP-binding protein, partial [Acetobacteraceae bacterium]|nr:AMP-binding protein [Acetobacteraceae bacterium]